MRNEYKFKLVRRVHYLPDTGDERVVHDILCKIEGKRIRLEIPAPDFNGYRALDAITNRSGHVFSDRERARLRLWALTQEKSPEVSKTSLYGWHRSTVGRAFVTPWGVLGEAEARRNYEYLENPMAASGSAGYAGTPGGWRRSVGRGLQKSTAGVTLVGAALAAPLIQFAELRESFAIILAGESSTGKSTIQDGAFSVQGPPKEESPDSSPRAFQERGAAYNHMLFALGDLTLLTPRARWALLSQLAYGLTAVASRATSKVNARTLPVLQFQNIVVCTSEMTSTDIAEAAGAERHGGEAVRLFDLTCSGGTGFFDRLDIGDDPAAVAEGISRGARENHGVILRQWIRRLVQREEKWLAEQLKLHTEKFMTAAADKGRTTERERRAARKFGLIYAALALAQQEGVIDWEPASIRHAVMRSYQVAMNNAPTASAAAAVLALRELLLEPGSIVEAAYAEDDPNWLGVRTTLRGKPMIGLRESAIVEALGRSKAKLGFRAWEEMGMLTIGKGQERWQKRLGATRHRLLQLDPAALLG